VGKKVVIAPLTSEAIREATEKGRATIDAPSAVMDASITALANDLFLSLVFRDGSRLAIPIERIEELSGLSKKVLETVEIAPLRDAISIRQAEVDIYVPGLLAMLYGSIVSAQNGRVGGRSKSAAKASAVRKNGRKGGRPRKDHVEA
jgi:hypothetical protein